MSKRLTEYITTSYVGAASQLGSRTGRKKIIAYVESYDDVFFWRTLLNQFETDKYYFEVMLPSRTSLQKGKKSVLMNLLSNGFGQNMIACVDADYDYLMQGFNDTSELLCRNPYIFHTHAYAIENFQCYSASLHEVCVMATLNDRQLFLFEPFMEEYSRIIFPMLVWSLWCYENRNSSAFTLSDMALVTTLPDVDLQKPEVALEKLRHKVNVQQNRLQKLFPQAKGKWQSLRQQLLSLGVTPETAYLYMRGHDLFEKVVLPLLEDVCRHLRREREREIQRNAVHAKQYQNELSGYQHACGSPSEMLRKHTYYQTCPLYQHIRNDIQAFMNRLKESQTRAKQ